MDGVAVEPLHDGKPAGLLDESFEMIRRHAEFVSIEINLAQVGVLK